MSTDEIVQLIIMQTQYALFLSCDKNFPSPRGRAICLAFSFQPVCPRGPHAFIARVQRWRSWREICFCYVRLSPLRRNTSFLCVTVTLTLRNFSNISMPSCIRR